MIVSLRDAVTPALDTLRSGDAVVVPFPTPLPYGVAATTPEAVNRAKRRPEGQPTGIAVADFAAVVPHLDLDDAAARLAGWLCTDQHINIFVSPARGAPGWLVQDGTGVVGLMGSWLPELRGVLDPLGHLYVSSANVSKEEVATTAAAADRAFGGHLLVADGDARRDAGVPHGSATIIRVSATGDLSVVRRGVNDAAFADGPAFLGELRDRYAVAGEPQ